MKLDRKGYSRLLILNSTIIFLNFVTKMSCRFGPKTSMQNVQNENPYKEYSEMLILNSAIVFFSSMSFFLGGGGGGGGGGEGGNLVSKLQSALFKIKLSTKGIQEYRFWIQQLVSQIPPLKIVFGENLVLELQSTLFAMNLGTKGYSRVLIMIDPKGCCNQHLWVPLYTYFHSKQTTVKIQDQICPKKLF